MRNQVLRITGALVSLSLAAIWFRGEGAKPVAARQAGKRDSPRSPVAARPRILDTPSRMPIVFEANRGQTDERVKFLSRGRGYSLFLTRAEAVLVLQGTKAKSGISNEASAGSPAHHSFLNPTALRPVPGFFKPPAAEPDSAPFGEQLKGGSALSGPSRAPESRTPAVLRMRLAGANPAVQVSGVEELPGKSNYFIGNDPKKWRTNVPNYAQVAYKNVYPGVDLIYYGNQLQLEYDFVVAPGADPNAIKLSFQGARRIRMDEGSGDLVLDVGEGEIRLRRPAIYQTDFDVRRSITRNALPSPNPKPLTFVEGHYVLRDSKLETRNSKSEKPQSKIRNPKSKIEVGFELAAYDRARPLIIDPALVYSTYLGGTQYEIGFSIAVDSAGSAYITGITDSADFPTSDPWQAANGGGADAFVTKLDPTGSALVYSTYLGGSADDVGYSIAVDGLGNAYLTGYTCSNDFPTANPLQPDFAGGPCHILGGDAFVAKLNPTGSLLYSTYFGGSDDDSGIGIAVDASGSAYVTGVTLSTDMPTANAFQLAYGGGKIYGDAFVAKLTPTGSALVYSTYLGGSRDERGIRIAVDAFGSAYVIGSTLSTDFPTRNALQPVYGGGTLVGDAFVTKLSPTGTELVYSTYLGGSDEDEGLGIAVDSAGNAYLTGDTHSSDFPTASPFQADNAGGDDAFIAKLAPSGESLIYSTYLGGSNDDHGIGIAVDTAGSVYLTGWTQSSDFPTANPWQPNYGGGSCGSAYLCRDAFVARFDQAGSALLYSSYLGGSADDVGVAIAIDAPGNAYVTGLTTSTDFPTVNPFQPENGGGDGDAFVTKIGP